LIILKRYSQGETVLHDRLQINMLDE